ncbi:MAG: M24 family metallopeptidase [Halanaeroarchaeum sp.]
MDLDLSRLLQALDDRDLDGYLLDADSETANQRYLSGFDAPDPFFTVVTERGTALLVSTLEYGRASKESRADVVRGLADYDGRELVAEYGAAEGRVRTLARFLSDLGVDSVAVDRRFPLATARGLEELGVAVAVDRDDTVERIRAVKTETEIESVREAQRANEVAMAEAERLIAEAEVVDGTLTHEGRPLTSERIRTAIERTLLDHGCALDETIVAAGPDGADPHDQGSGPIGVDEPVIVDVFPRDKETHYHADMTRTFLRGSPTETVREFYDLTREAKAAAMDAVEPGATGEAVHAAVCEVYEDAGYPTLRTDEGTDRGFVHSTGHGVGLEVHERPRIAREGETLEPGHVITIEPGLYDPAVGGVRIEDLLVVTEDGFENLTDYPETLVV